MTQKELLDSIKKHLARFEAQVTISNANNEYDINIHSENVIIPILNPLFDCKLKNVNYSDGKNAEAIDLIDENKGIAFQVTSTNDLTKIKKTLTKLLTSKYKNKINTLFVYILTKKQDNYSQEALNKIIGNKIKFSTKENIVDGGGLYRKINEINNIVIIEEIEAFLKYQFSDVYLNKTFTLSKLELFKENYKNSCIANFSRINFFGLSVNNNKPREIELYLLFVSPSFSTSTSSLNYILPNEERLLGMFIEDRMSDLQIRNTNFQIKLNDSSVQNETLSKYLTERGLISIGGYPNLKLFETFHHGFKRSQKKSFAELFSGSKNIVVIGKPGAGKSSFIKYSICKILEADETIFSNKEVYQYIPFRIELHKYNRYKKLKGGGFTNYLVELLQDEYQINISIDDIGSIIKTFSTLIFFDGLDEIFDIHERLAVRNDIEMFVKSFAKVRSIVTSRFESYEEVNLSEKLFSSYEILDFNETQVEEYVKKWYAVEETNNVTREREVRNCLLQLNHVDKELKNNPLLLSLILLLYRNELDIPTSKLSIYESCTNTIVETRDTKEKKLDIKLKIGNVISVFAAIAYWQFEIESAGKGVVNYETVKNYIKKYLIDKGEFSEENIAELATNEFIDFAKTRSIYLENKFTHKTFLEYFTAYYIYSFYYGNWKKAQELSELISKCIGLSAWSVVLELLICKIDSTQINYEVVDDLVEQQFEIHFLDSLIFFLQILKYLKNISPLKTKYIIEKSIEFCFKEGETTKEQKIDYKEVLFFNLTSIAALERFKDIIETSFKEFLEKTSINSIYLNAFAYEFAIVSGNTTLVKILQDLNLESDTDYIFILKHYPNLFENSKFIETLKLFKEKFDENKLSEVYKSRFNQQIFFNSASFNWIITYISSSYPENPIQYSYSKIVDEGISKEVIIEAAKRKSAQLTFGQSDLDQTYLNAKDSACKRFIKNLRSTYFHVQDTPAKRNELFYDKFFKKNGKGKAKSKVKRKR